MRYVVFVSSIPIDDEKEEPDWGISGVGHTDDEIVREAQDILSELWAQDGPSEPWIVTEDHLAVIERVLSEEKW